MTDYDIKQVSPRPWKVVWDLGMTLHRSDYYERLQFATKSERDAREAEWNESHEEQASRGYWIADANGDIVEYGMLYSSYGFRVSEADVEHTVRCVNDAAMKEQP